MTFKDGSCEPEEQIAAVDNNMDRIRCLAEIDQEQLDKTRKDQLDFEKELFEQKLQYTKELENLHATSTT